MWGPAVGVNGRADARIASVSTSFPLDGMRVRFAGATNIGRKRDHNEDSISLPENERLAIVADGMGGHASGEVASRLAVEMVSDHFAETSKQQTLTWPMISASSRK